MLLFAAEARLQAIKDNDDLLIYTAHFEGVKDQAKEEEDKVSSDKSVYTFSTDSTEVCITQKRFARRIQRVYRNHLAKRKNLQEKAAIRIQCIFRMNCAIAALRQLQSEP